MFIKKIFFLLFIIIFNNETLAKQLTNNVIVSIDNSIITELDVNKEINFLKFINKDLTVNISEILKKEIINTLIDRKIKDIETNFYKIDVSEKEIENSLYNSEVNRQLEQEQKNSDDNEKFKNQLITIEQNKLLNKFAATHLEKSKKKYLIKFL